jgi:hypothetical protein
MKMPQRQLKVPRVDTRRSQSQLERQNLAAPWLLIVAGVLLVIAGFKYRSASDVAAPAVVIGAAIVVLGVLLPRLEGVVQIGPNGLQVGIRRIEDLVKRDDVVPASKQDDLNDIARIDFVSAVSGRLVAPKEIPGLAVEAFERAKNNLTDFEVRVKKWLFVDGWKVESSKPGQLDKAVDYEAIKPNATMFVETKVSRDALHRADILPMVTEFQRIRDSWNDDSINLSFALFVSAPRIMGSGLNLLIGAKVRLFLELGTGFTEVNIGSS